MLLLVNFLFVPQYGYIACAWGGVAGYGTAMVVSYLLGQHYMPINYPIKDIALYVALTAVLYVAGSAFTVDSEVVMTFYRSLLLLLFLGFILKREGLYAKLKSRLHRH